MTKLQRWDAALRSADTCPWPGPRPLLQQDANQLIGREGDVRELIGLVASRRLLIVTGETGVGKSSLINAGLIPAFKKRGWLSVVVNEWGSKGSTSVDERMAGAVKDQVPRSMLVTNGRKDIWAALDAIVTSGKRKIVLVLDQFEELIRFREKDFERAVTFLKKLNSDTDLSVVISLRTEYVHRLRDLERAAKTFSSQHFEVEPLLDADTVKKIVESGGPAAISENAVWGLKERWRAEVEESDKIGDRSDGNLGLIHLQGTLYTLHRLANGGTVTETVLGSLALEAAKRSLFVHGLEVSVEEKLNVCLTAGRELACDAAQCPGSTCTDPRHPDVMLDDYLLEGTKAAVVASATHLSTGGYKTSISRTDLIARMMGRRLSVLRQELGLSLEAVERVIKEFDKSPDFLSKGREEVLASIQPHSVAEGVEVRDDVAAGPLMGQPQLAALIEETRRSLFALAWLEALRLIRATPTSEGVMVSLIHDGFGQALNGWAGTYQTVLSALYQLTLVRGEVLDWQKRQADQADFRFEVGLTWRDCTITGTIEDTVFVNCDFRNSIFHKVSLRGVTFVNCLLDGTTLRECKIEGDVTHHPSMAFPEDKTPSFEVNLPVKLSTTLAAYRGTSTPDHWVSVTSGLPLRAVTSTDSPDAVSHGFARVEWAPTEGGVALIGGRVSSLMLYRCYSKGIGATGFFGVQGSGLDLVEHGASLLDLDDRAHRVVIRGSQIRSLALTRDPDEWGIDSWRDEASDGTNPLEVDIDGSLLLMATFGAGVKGSAHINNSRVWGMVNASGQDSQPFRVHLTDCGYWAVMNATEVTSSRPTPEFRVDEQSLLTKAGGGLTTVLSTAVEDTNYHYHPEKWADRSRG